MKTPPALPCGLRILLVEDEEASVRSVSYDLRRALIEPCIDVAETVAEAEVKIRAAADEGPPLRRGDFGLHAAAR